MSNNESITNPDAYREPPESAEQAAETSIPRSLYATDSREERRHIIVRIGIIIGGTIVLFVGIALLVLPGPAFVVIPAGLAILGTELVWARRLLRHVKRKVGLEQREADEATDENGTRRDDGAVSSND